jgi:hypothetical protein
MLFAKHLPTRSQVLSTGLRAERIGAATKSHNTSQKEEVRKMARRWDDINGLCDIVRETSFSIHCYLGFGHLEKIYRRALVHRLRKQGLRVEEEPPVEVYDEDGIKLTRVCSRSLR